MPGQKAVNFRESPFFGQGRRQVAEAMALTLTPVGELPPGVLDGWPVGR